MLVVVLLPWWALFRPVEDGSLVVSGHGGRLRGRSGHRPRAWLAQPRDRTVLAVESGVRHPVLAITIGASNFSRGEGVARAGSLRARIHRHRGELFALARKASGSSREGYGSGLVDEIQMKETNTIQEFIALHWPTHDTKWGAGWAWCVKRRIPPGWAWHSALLAWGVLLRRRFRMGLSHKALWLAAMAIHVRFLVVIPLFFFAEAWVIPQMAEFVRHIVRYGVVPEILTANLGGGHPPGPAR